MSLNNITHNNAVIKNFCLQSESASKESPKSLFVEVTTGNLISVFTNTVRTQNWLEHPLRYKVRHIVTARREIEKERVQALVSEIA